jgi:hypothetical protein
MALSKMPGCLLKIASRISEMKIKIFNVWKLIKLLSMYQNIKCSSTKHTKAIDSS